MARTRLTRVIGNGASRYGTAIPRENRVFHPISSRMIAPSTGTIDSMLRNTRHQHSCTTNTSYSNKDNNSDTVRFWLPIVGSGVATIISMYLAYRSLQQEIEKNQQEMKNALKDHQEKQREYYLSREDQLSNNKEIEQKMSAYSRYKEPDNTSDDMLNQQRERAKRDMPEVLEFMNQLDLEPREVGRKIVQKICLVLNLAAAGFIFKQEGRMSAEILTKLKKFCDNKIGISERDKAYDIHRKLLDYGGEDLADEYCHTLYLFGRAIKNGHFLDKPENSGKNVNPPEECHADYWEKKRKSYINLSVALGELIDKETRVPRLLTLLCKSEEMDLSSDKASIVKAMKAHARAQHLTGMYKDKDTGNFRPDITKNATNRFRCYQDIAKGYEKLNELDDKEFPIKFTGVKDFDGNELPGITERSECLHHALIYFKKAREMWDKRKDEDYPPQFDNVQVDKHIKRIEEEITSRLSSPPLSSQPSCCKR